MLAREDLKHLTALLEDDDACFAEMHSDIEVFLHAASTHIR